MTWNHLPYKAKTLHTAGAGNKRQENVSGVLQSKVDIFAPQFSLQPV